MFLNKYSIVFLTLMVTLASNYDKYKVPPVIVITSTSVVTPPYVECREIITPSPVIIEPHRFGITDIVTTGNVIDVIERVWYATRQTENYK